MPCDPCSPERGPKSGDFHKQGKTKMPRIRTIKPEFFRDEDLQELQGQHTTMPLMLVYAALWGHCDKNGTFEWRPKQLKLDILPFLPFSMEHALELLEGAGFIKKFEALGKHYGSIRTFKDHQRISGSEASDPAKYPEYQEKQIHDAKEAAGKQRGSSGDELVSQEGKGRERKGSAFALPDWVPLDAWESFVESRRKNRAPLTDRAKALAVAELSRLRDQGHSPAAVIDLAVLKGWKSFYAPKGSTAAPADDPYKGVTW